MGSWGQQLPEESEPRREFLQLLRRGLSFIVNRQLAMAFAAFKPAPPPRSDDPMAQAARFMLNRKLAVGWVKWHGGG